jgi:hypothetical protein
MKTHRDCAEESRNEVLELWHCGEHLSVAPSPDSAKRTLSRERVSIIDQQAPWLLGLSFPRSLLALASGQIMVQAMGLLLAATAVGFLLHMRLDRRFVTNGENLSPQIPEVSLGERLLPVVFALSTIVIVVAPIVWTWISLHPGP